MEVQKLVANLIRCYNKQNNDSVRTSNEFNQKLIESALGSDVNGNYWKLKDYIEKNKSTVGFRKFIGDYVAKQVSDSPVVEEKTSPVTVTESAPAVSKDEIKSEVLAELKAEQAVSQLGLLERTLAQVVVQTQGESIKNAIIEDFQAQAAKFIQDTYGTIHRKVEVEVGDVTTQFDEVLHEKFDTVLKFVQMNEPVFLTGQAGTGKNVLCQQVAKALNLDFYFTNAVTQEYKLTGFTDANGIFHETQFYQAFKNGGLFMLDEMDASIPEVLVILNAAIANRYFDFPHGKDKDGNEVGGFTKAHENFRVIAAGNTFGLGADYEYVGRNQLDMASLDRFALIEVAYDREIEKAVAEGDTELVNFIEDVRRVARDNGIRIVVSYRSIGRIAKMKKLLPLEDVLKSCLFKNLRSDDLSTLYNDLSSNMYSQAMRNLF